MAQQFYIIKFPIKKQMRKEVALGEFLDGLIDPSALCLLQVIDERNRSSSCLGGQNPIHGYSLQPYRDLRNRRTDGNSFGLE